MIKNSFQKLFQVEVDDLFKDEDSFDIKGQKFRI